MNAATRYPSSRLSAKPRPPSELATAQILAEFTHKDHPCEAAPGCDYICRSHLTERCSEECEIPCTAECTDQCVVVCEEPHDVDDGLCCDLQNACDNRDCEYSYLDEYCCMGCPTDPYPGLTSPLDHMGTSGDFTYPTPPQYNHIQHAQGPVMDPQPSSLPESALVHRDQCAFRLSCYTSLHFPQSAMTCSMNDTDEYATSPIPSLVPSASESPWSLQSTLSGQSGVHFSPVAAIDQDNPLNILADYSTNDLNFSVNLDRARNASESLHQDIQNGPVHGNRDLSSSFLADSELSQVKLDGPSSLIGYLGVDSLPELSNLAGPVKPVLNLQCRWLIDDVHAPKLCGCSFNSREDLHKHIIEDHVKTMRRRGASTTPVIPVCRWHGCESAKKMKVFKLQHLKDHIVCHSKLRIRCEVCGKECRDAKVLKLHMNSHRPGQEKPFRCDFEGCNASFGTSALLSSHKRVHTGEKPHKCSWCTYRAADKGNLRRHEEEMHMGKKWPCPYCSQQLAKKANLTRHIRDLHPNEMEKQQSTAAVNSIIRS